MSIDGHAVEVEVRCPACGHLIGLGINWFKSEDFKCLNCGKVSLIEPSSKDQNMSIDATVETVHHYENGSGKLALTGESRGCSALYFDAAPHDVTALNRRKIWGGDLSILIGAVEIAKREGYTKIVFCIESVSQAIAEAERIFEERHPGSKPTF